MLHSLLCPSAFLLVLGSTACSSAPPPSPSSPVYAADVTQDLEPLPVERLSIDEPQPVQVSPTEKAPPAATPPAESASQPAEKQAAETGKSEKISEPEVAAQKQESDASEKNTQTLP